MPQRSGHCAAIHRVLVEQGVEQGQEPVAEVESGPDNGSSLSPPDTRVLVNTPQRVVVPDRNNNGISKLSLIQLLLNTVKSADKACMVVWKPRFLTKIVVYCL